MVQMNTNKPENFYLKLVQQVDRAGTTPIPVYLHGAGTESASVRVYFAFLVEHEWTSLNRKRQVKFYKIQALYVSSSKNEPSEK